MNQEVFLKIQKQKSIQANNQKLDSIVTNYWDNYWKQWVKLKTIFTNDASGNNTSYTSNTWDLNSFKLVNYEKTEYTYDGNGKITMSLHYLGTLTLISGILE
jgi:YD repeat-containing protein